MLSSFVLHNGLLVRPIFRLRPVFSYAEKTRDKLFGSLGSNYAFSSWPAASARLLRVSGLIFWFAPTTISLPCVS